MIRIAIPVETVELCSYGCGQLAKFVNGSKKLMCCERSNSCPENKKKNSKGVQTAHNDGRIPGWNNLVENGLNRGWSKGLTKDIDIRVARPNLIGKRFGASLTGHTEESKAKIAKARTEWLKKSENRKNLGRHKKSWMEETFEKYLLENSIIGFETEKHFWNDEDRKNYYPDFIFEDAKLIIELDGTQHKKTIELDEKRDKWFLTKGYIVVRISHNEFKERYFSGKGFMDICPPSPTG